MNGPRIVMLTDGGPNARRLAKLMTRDAIDYEILTFAYPMPPRGKKPRGAYLARSAVKFLKSFRVLRLLWQLRYPRFPRRSRFVGYCNGERMLRILRDTKPDYIVMMGGCILSPSAIGTARRGVLNAHPGILPWARGMNVMEHSVLRGIPLGATCHFIDAGIDTGPILLRYLLPIRGEKTVPELTARLTDLTTAMMLEVVTRLWRGESLAAETQEERFPYCGRISSAEQREAAQLLERGKAEELYLLGRIGETTISDGTEALRQASSD
ncbi:hypothetical protein BH09GEM1_BH09GEM1_35760 [soil metagenome]